MFAWPNTDYRCAGELPTLFTVDCRVKFRSDLISWRWWLHFDIWVTCFPLVEAVNWSHNLFESHLEEVSGATYRLLHSVFDPSPDLSPSRLYQPEPGEQGLIRSEG